MGYGQPLRHFRLRKTKPVCGFATGRTHGSCPLPPPRSLPGGQATSFPVVYQNHDVRSFCFLSSSSSLRCSTKSRSAIGTFSAYHASFPVLSPPRSNKAERTNLVWALFTCHLSSRSLFKCMQTLQRPGAIPSPMVRASLHLPSEAIGQDTAAADLEQGHSRL